MTGIGTVDVHIGHRNLPRRLHASQPGGTTARRARIVQATRRSRCGTAIERARIRWPQCLIRAADRDDTRK
ncbi:conserved hypothetical protein [Burkholderia pseudomallei Pakistan 9]|nr:conserved hypothetical protein [Burkholderia pseudomallei 576]EEH30801.1 conserved hypothetical protein [Burkholderia pseudomallei Pakistan 9]